MESARINIIGVVGVGCWFPCVTQPGIVTHTGSGGSSTILNSKGLGPSSIVSVPGQPCPGSKFSERRDTGRIQNAAVHVVGVVSVCARLYSGRGRPRTVFSKEGGVPLSIATEFKDFWNPVRMKHVAVHIVGAMRVRVRVSVVAETCVIAHASRGGRCTILYRKGAVGLAIIIGAGKTSARRQFRRVTLYSRGVNIVVSVEGA